MLERSTAMTKSANITTLARTRQTFEAALRDIEIPLWRLNGLVCALRICSRHKEENQDEFREAVDAIQQNIEDLVFEMQKAFDSAFDGPGFSSERQPH
jgi:hypothetical protein